MTHYFIGHDLVASRDFAKRPINHAYFCSTCGEVWGRIFTEGCPWKVAEVPCEKHEPVGVWDWRTVPGSLLQLGHGGTNYAVVDLELIPEPILKREFAIHLNYYERGALSEHSTSNNTE